MPNFSLTVVAPSVFVLIAGLLLWIRGYKLFRISLALAGLWAGFALATVLDHSLHFSQTLFPVLVVCLGLGLALLCSMAYRLSFLLGGAALTCYLMHHYVFTLFQGNHSFLLLIAAGIGALAGLLLHKSFLIYATSWVGSILILQGILALLEQQEWLSLTPSLLYSRPATHWLGLLLPLVLTAVGARIQLSKKGRT